MLDAAPQRLVQKLVDAGHHVFTLDDARTMAARLEIGPTYVGPLLSRLLREGAVVRVKRGTYAIQSAEHGASAHAFVVAMALATPAVISNRSAMHHHELIDNPPVVIDVTSTQRTTTPIAARSDFRLHYVPPERFFGIEKHDMDGHEVSILDRERSFLDGFAMHSLRPEETTRILDMNVLDLDRLRGYAERYSSRVFHLVTKVLDQHSASRSSGQSFGQIA
jgi:predicted transcriptional regulator of viral defense system